MANSTRAGAQLATGSAVAQILEQAAGRPNLDAAQRRALTYANGRYRVGLDRYLSAVDTIGFRDAARVLDVGCGVGQWAIALATRNEHVVGVDLRPEYLDVAAQVARGLGLANRMRFRAGEAESLAEPPDSIDAVVSHMVMMWVPERERGLGEIARCLKDSGRAYIAYTTEAMLLREIAGAGRVDWERGRRPALNLLSNALHAVGAYQSFGSRVRAYEAGELEQLAGHFGLEVERSPHVEDGPHEWLGYRTSGDFVARKVCDADASERSFMEAHEKDELPGALDNLIALGAPRMALRILDRAGRLDVAGAERIRLTAHLRLGDLDAAGELLDNVPSEQAALLRGLYHLQRGDHASAIDELGHGSLSTDEQFLLGCARLSAGDHDGAGDLFRRELQADPGCPRALAGAILAALDAHDHETMAALIASFPAAAQSSPSENGSPRTRGVPPSADSTAVEELPGTSQPPRARTTTATTSDDPAIHAVQLGDAEPAEVDRRTRAVVQVRKFPYPFGAMLAISTDIDRTTMSVFRNLHRFMNTREVTPMGPGVGLDVSDSLWVFKAHNSDDIALLESHDRARPQEYADELADYARVGWIDTLHTYGNYSINRKSDQPPFERRHAEIAIAELRAREIFLTTWVNRGSRANIQNFGCGEPQEGDIPGSRAYHTDLLLEYGVRFAWNHEDGGTPGVDDPLSPLLLRDGRRLWGFPRYSHTFGPEALSRLDRLIEHSQYCIAAQHLGDLGGEQQFTPSTVETFSQLRRYQDEGRILIARISRLLEYSRVSQHVRFEIRRMARQLYIDVTEVRDPIVGAFVPKLEQLRGVTFYVDQPEGAHLLLNGRRIPNSDIIRSPTDGVAPSIGVRWFAEDTTDYSARYREEPGRPANRSPEYSKLDGFSVEELLTTGEAVELDELGLGHPGRIRYGPTNRKYLSLVLRDVEIGPEDVFVDLGSGKGRMLLVAASHPFKRVVGVEISEELCEVARRNLAHNADRLRSGGVEVIAADAAQWKLPDDVTVVYFFNAFTGALFRSAVENVVASLDRRPRKLTFIYMYPRDAELIEATGRFAQVRAERFGEKPLEQIVYYEAKAITTREIVLAERDRLPEGIDPKAFVDAVDYAARRFAVGLDYYEEILQRIGFVDCERALDVGSGSGHWCIALAGRNAAVVGLELRAEFVEVARRMARHFQVDDRVSFQIGRAEDADVAGAPFDLICCHSVLMFVDHEIALRNIGRWSAVDGRFYCGYTTSGMRVQDAVMGLADGDRKRAERGLAVLLSDARLRAGVGGRLGVKAFWREEVLRTCELVGFEFVSSPDVQDGVRTFLGLPCTFDFVCKRRAGDALEELRGGGPSQASWVARIRELIDVGLPSLALEALDAANADVAGPQAAALYLRARLRRGEPVEAEESLLAVLEESTRALLVGMSRHVAGDFERALQAYADAPAEHPDRAALMALCVLDLHRHDEAHGIASEMASGTRNGLREFAINTAAALGDDDLDAARSLAAELVIGLRDSGQAPAVRANDVLRRLQSSTAD